MVTSDRKNFNSKDSEMGQQLYERSDVEYAVITLSKLVKVGDLAITLKYSNRGWLDYDEAWSTVSMNMDIFCDWLDNLHSGDVENIIWGADIFESGYPHINMIVTLKSTLSPIIRNELVQLIKNKWHSMMHITDNFQPCHIHYIKDEGTQWTPTYYEKSCSIYHATRYIFKRATPPEVRRAVGISGVAEIHYSISGERHKLLIYPHVKEGGVVYL